MADHSSSTSCGVDAAGKNENTVNNDEQLNLMLAGINATLQEQNAYEGDVLRQATHRLAPKLLVDNVLGMPKPTATSLVYMHGSQDAANGPALPLHTVLGQTRRKIQKLDPNTRGDDFAANVLYMKEQILLHVFSTTINADQYPMRSLAEERGLEQARSQAIRRPHTGNESLSVTNDNQPREPKPPPTRQARIPMMKRKRISSGISNNDADEMAEARLTDQQKADLHQIRLRRNRRIAHRRIKRGRNFDDEETELPLGVGEDADNPPSKCPASDSGDDVARSNEKGSNITEKVGEPPNDDGSFSRRAISEVSSVATCPDCGVTLAVDANSDVDTILAQHLGSCTGSFTTRARRVSQRQSTRIKRPIASYAEPHFDKIEDSDFETDDGDQQTTTTVRKASAASISPANPAYRRADNDEPPMTNQTLTPLLSSLAAATTAMDDIDEWAYEDRVDDWIAHGLDRMKSMRERDESEALPGAQEYDGGLLIPTWMNDRLFEYQRESLRWMWDLHQQNAGGIIGDEMGLGKTVQVASFLGAAASSRKLNSVLIIAPATILQHWLRELSVWAPGLRRVLVHTSGGDVNGSTRTISAALLQRLSNWLRKSRMDRVNEAIDEEDWNSLESHSFCGTGYIILTTYENLRRNTDLYAAHSWSYIVLDEAQKIRNPDADVTLACKRIRTFHRLAMSGTPIQNDLRELWSLFDFVFPGRLGTLPTFEQEFSIPIKRGGYSNASPMQVQLAYRCAITLRDLIQPFLLRRLKKDVKEVSRMPGKTEHVLFCRLSQRQRAMYEAYLQSDDVKSVIRGGTQLLAAITMLRKIANHPDLVCDPSESSFVGFVHNRGSMHPRHTVEDESDEDDDDIYHEETLLERSGKLEVLAKILPLWKKQGHRVLIFCQWRKMLNIIERFTRLNNWKFGRLDGNTNIASRQRLVDTFNSDESYFGMLCTTRTGGVGLNLTGANRCVIYDPDFNPSGDAQARERAWRFGQEKEVTIYRLITSGTIEEQIYKRQIFKTALSNKVLQDPRQRRLFSQNDLRDLFSLSADTGSLRSGGDGITETSKVTKGVGVVDIVTDISNDDDDNDATLQNIVKSKGLAGIFDHHSVEPDNKRQTTTALEMEVHAKRVAKEAVKALQQSVETHNPFTPTWTGSVETNPSRFVTSRPAIREKNHNATFTTPSLVAGAMSSSNLLLKLRQRNSAIESGGSSDQSRSVVSDAHKYSNLLDRLKDFIRQQHPSTEQILEEFDNVPDSDVAIFKQLLKSVASVNRGRWILTNA